MTTNQKRRKHRTLVPDDESDELRPDPEAQQTKPSASSIVAEDRSNANSARRSDRKQKRRKKKRLPVYPSDAHERVRRYIYSAISATFLFVLLREMGFIDLMQDSVSNQVEMRQKPSTAHTGKAIPSLASAAANMAATSMTLSQTPNTGSSQTFNTAVNDPKNYLSRNEMMEIVMQKDSTIEDGSRPVIYTFFEWIPPRTRGTSMTDVADKALINEWREAWKEAGWHPKILTMKDVKKHAEYEDYALRLKEIPMLGVDGLGGNVAYNQLCFYRWLAMAAAGGGFMCDYDVFPISTSPSVLQKDTNFTVYCKIRHSKKAGIPCLMSGSSRQWTDMAYKLLDNGVKNSKTGETMWSDMLALIDLRNDNVYEIADKVLEGQDVLLKRGWSKEDCNITTPYMAIHFSHESLKLGYVPDDESAEDRPAIIRRFLAKWHEACGVASTLTGRSAGAAPTSQMMPVTGDSTGASPHQMMMVPNGGTQSQLQTNQMMAASGGLQPQQ